MSVSIAFSVVIFRGMSLEVERFARLQQVRFERQFDEFGVPPPVFIDNEVVKEMKDHIIIVLFWINGVILIVMGGLSYFLAGKTLAPIREMVEEQNRFISDASHELRTPLTAMKSSLEVYLRDPKLTLLEAKDVLSENIQEVNRLSSLSESLLTLSENQTGSRDGFFSPIDPKHILTKSLHLVKHSADKKNITLSMAKTPSKKIVGNEEKLIALFTILLDNAIKYSPEKSTISLSGEGYKKYVELRVEDKGIGIGKKDLPHVFDRFYRSNSARSKEGAGGYGLGLSIAKKIVSLHRGSIHIESIVNKGTTVIVRLPSASA
jgi:signal transduction histidine kinase